MPPIRMQVLYNQWLTTQRPALVVSTYSGLFRPVPTKKINPKTPKNITTTPNSMRPCFKNCPVGGPGLQNRRFLAISCRPRALTRRLQRISKHALSRFGKFARLAEQVQAVVKSRQASAFAASTSAEATALDGMADKTAQRAVKGTVRTVRTVKWVFYLFFNRNLLPPNVFQPKWDTGILRIIRKILRVGVWGEGWGKSKNYEL